MTHTLTDHCKAAYSGEVLELADLVRRPPATPAEAVDILGAVLGLTAPEPTVEEIVDEVLDDYNEEEGE